MFDCEYYSICYNIVSGMYRMTKYDTLNVLLVNIFGFRNAKVD